MGREVLKTNVMSRGIEKQIQIILSEKEYQDLGKAADYCQKLPNRYARDAVTDRVRFDLEMLNRLSGDGALIIRENQSLLAIRKTESAIKDLEKKLAEMRTQHEKEFGELE